MAQIHRESLTRFETVTLDYQIPVWKEGSNDDATLKRITLRDFFASDVVTTAVDPPNWATNGLTATGAHTHNLGGHKITLSNGEHEFSANLVFRMLGTMYAPAVPQDDTLEKFTVLDPSTGQLKWRALSTLPGVSDGDKGDIVVSSSGATWTLDAGVVRNVNLEQMNAGTIKGRIGTTGDPQDLSDAQVRSIINVEDGATADQTDLEIKVAYQNVVATATQSQAEAGSSGIVRNWTPYRIRQAIEAIAPAQDISGIATNTANIATNVIGINNLASSIVSNDSDIATNAANIASMNSTVLALVTDVTSNDTDIATNATNIATNVTAIALNTAKVTNATHTGEVTGSGALTIADDVVDEANLKVSNAPTNGHALIARSGEAGGLKWEAISATVADGSVTNAKLADVATNTFKGRATAGTGSPEDLTAAQARTVLNVEDGATADQTASEIRTLLGTGNSGVVPAAGTAGHFLKHDGTFGLPAYIANTDTQLTNAEVRAAVEAASDSNVFTDADHTKLNGIETAADVTDTTNVVAALTAGTNITISAGGTIAASSGTASPLTTKGDVYTYDTGNARLPVGTNGQALVADSTEATGLKWKNLSETPAVGGGLLVKATAATAGQTFNATEHEVINYEEDYDANGDWDDATHSFTVSATSGSGTYLFSACAFSSAAGANRWVWLRANVNGTPDGNGYIAATGDGTYHNISATETTDESWKCPSGSVAINLNVGDVVYLTLYHSAGNHNNTSHTEKNTLTVSKLSGIKGEKGDTGTGAPVSLTKTIVLEAPTTSDYIPIFRTDVAITIQEAMGALLAAGDVDVQLYWDGDMAYAGATAIGAITTLTATTESAVSIVSDPSIPADNWVFLKILETTTAQTVVVNIEYTED